MPQHQHMDMMTPGREMVFQPGKRGPGRVSETLWVYVGWGLGANVMPWWGHKPILLGDMAMGS